MKPCSSLPSLFSLKFLLLLTCICVCSSSTAFAAVGEDDGFSLLPGTASAVLDVRANDTFNPADPCDLTVGLIFGGDTLGGGTVTVNGDCEVVYTPAPGGNTEGTADVFEYEICDSDGCDAGIAVVVIFETPSNVVATCEIVDATLTCDGTSVVGTVEVDEAGPYAVQLDGTQVGASTGGTVIPVAVPASFSGQTATLSISNTATACTDSLMVDVPVCEEPPPEPLVVQVFKTVVADGTPCPITGTDGFDSIPAAIGDPVTYCIRISNMGPGTAFGVEVVDTRDPQSPRSFGDIAADSEVFYSYSHTVVDAIETNTATVSAMDADGNDVGDSDTAGTTEVPVVDPCDVSPSVDLSIMKTAVGPIVLGAPATFSLVVSNAGPCTAENVLVSDILDPTFFENAGLTEWLLPELAAGASTNILYTETLVSCVTNANVLTNSATITNDITDTDAANNASTVLASPDVLIDLSVLKIAPTQAVSAASFAYELMLVNAGPSDAVDVELVDVLPPEILVISNSCGGAVSAGVFAVSFPKVAVGATQMCTLVVATTNCCADASLTNLAMSVLAGGGTDTNPSNNMAMAVTEILPETVPPMILTCPTNLMVASRELVPPPDLAAFAATDTCSDVSLALLTNEVVAACSGIVTYTYTASDACGNETSCVQTITYAVDELISVICPSNVTVSCISDVPPADLDALAVSEACDELVVSVVTNGTLTSCPGMLAYVYTVTGSGSAVSCTQTVSLIDNEPPTFTVSDVTVQCFYDVESAVGGNLTISDNCGASLVAPQFIDVPGSCTGAVDVVYMAVDDCGNAVSFTQTFSWVNTIPPPITCPADLSLPAGAVFEPDPSVVESLNVCGEITTGAVSTTTNVGPCGEVIEVVYTVTDNCGLSSSCTQMVTRAAQVAPTITCPPDMLVDCPNAIPPLDMAGVVATDSCSSVRVSVVTNGTLTSCLDMLELVYTATNEEGLTATCTQIVTYLDTEDPTFTVSNVTVFCSIDVVPAIGGSYTIADNCGATVVAPQDVDVPSTCTGSVDVVYMAEDACGNAVSFTQTISWVNTIPPPIRCPDDLLLPPEGTFVIDPSLVETINVCGEIATGTVSAATNVGPCGEVIEVVYTVMDDCGLSSSCTQIVARSAAVVPTISCPPDLSFDCIDAVPTADLGGVVATDLCSAVSVGVVTNGSISACGDTLAFVYTATNQDGFSAACTQIVTYLDTDAPTFTVSNVTVFCSADVEPAIGGNLSISDNCGATLIAPQSVDVPNTCTGSVDVVYMAEDVCGNAVSFTQTISWLNTVPPPITCPADMVLAAGTPFEPDTEALRSLNLCGEITTVSASSTTNVGTCGEVIEVVYTATDPCGLSSRCTQMVARTIRVVPSITCPEDIEIDCPDEIPPPSLAGVVATDLCSEVIVSVVTNGSLVACSDSIELIYTATNGDGLTATCTQTVTYIDTQIPTLFVSNRVVACAAEVEDAVGGEVVADNCGATVQMAELPPIPASCSGSVDVVYVAQDDCGNAVTFTQTISWLSTTPPPIGCPDDLTLPAGAAFEPDVEALQSVNECGEMATISARVSTNAPGLCEEIIEVVYTATDGCGLSSSCTQVVTRAIDLPPSITCPENIEVSCVDELADVALGSVVATDVCEQVTVSAVTNGSISGCAGTLEIVYTATDLGGMSAVCTQQVRVVDTEAPEILVSNLMVACASDVADIAGTGVAVMDNCGATLEMPVLAVLPLSCSGSTDLVFVARDACGNTATATQTISWADTVPPVVTECPASITLVPGVAFTPDPNAIQADDNCGLAPLQISQSTITNPCGEATEVLYTVSDLCGNQRVCTQLVSRGTASEPTIICPPDASVECLSDVPPPGMPEVVDPCTIPMVMVSTNITGDDCSGAVVIVYTASNAFGNSAACTQTITFLDTTPPMLTCPASVTLPFGSPVEPDPDVMATDNCGTATVTSTVGEVAARGGASGAFEIVYTATDPCGNSAVCTQLVTISESLPPTIVCPEDLTLSPGTTFEPDLAGLVVRSNCGTVAVTVVQSAVTNLCDIDIDVVYTAMDECGMSASCTQRVSTGVVTIPQISCPAGGAVSCLSEVPGPGVPDVSDACSDVIVSVSTNQIGDDCAGEVQYLFTVANAFGNMAVCTQRFLVVDDVAPTISCVPELTLNPEFDTLIPVDQADLILSLGDNCGVVSAAILGEPAFGCEDAGTNLVLIVATDGCGNTATCVVPVVVEACPPPPPIDLPSIGVNISVDDPGCFCAFGEGSFTISITNDGPVDLRDVVLEDPLYPACSSNIGVLAIGASIEYVCAVTLTGTFNQVFASGTANGETATDEKTVTYAFDDTPPVIVSCPANLELTCGEPLPVADPLALTVTDDCDAEIAAELVETIPLPNCAGDGVMYVFQAMDRCGNISASCTQTVTYAALEAPSFSNPPADEVVECGASPSFPNPLATNACGDAIPFQVSTAMLEANCTGEAQIERVYFGSDACGQSLAHTQLITFVDTTPPVIACGDDQTIEMPSLDCIFPVPEVAATTEDNCEGAVTIEQQPAAGTMMDMSQPLVVMLTATDACGNQSACSVTYTYICNVEISGVVWQDLAMDGTPSNDDISALAVENVDVTLLNEAGEVVARTITDSLGRYSFIVPPGVYALAFDEDDLPNEFAQSTLPGIVNATNGNVVDANLGVSPLPTAIRLQQFDATISDGELRVDWTTAWEENTLGYRVWRGTAEGVFEALEPFVLAEGKGSTYQLSDLDGVATHYWLEVVDNDLGSEFVATAPTTVLAPPDGPADQILSAPDGSIEFAMEADGNVFVAGLVSEPIITDLTSGFLLKGEVVEVDGAFGVYLGLRAGQRVLVE